MILQGSYIYMDHLQALNLYTTPTAQSPEILPSAVYTPLDAQQWAHDLQFHPDKRFSSYILQGLHFGFRIGFNRAQPLHPAALNLQSSNS